ncbi:uncharacterized protein LOC123673371 [Harmonia axyridis]|uniref:uncharacterized protein LOC123673371 n=1 Tax=Harmonia axyridis TaxID=115357 RepID=UPI001E279303|nr:uncharacterized protein LOC123673371 [Harmonia axyridis]
MHPNPEDNLPLTPAHFLIGRTLTSLPEGDYTCIPENRLKLYQGRQRMVQSFWKRWSLEYLGNLQTRLKWKTHHANLLKPDSLVIIKEDNLPPLVWKMARVVECFPGTDGVIRVVSVRLSDGNVLKRPVNKLCPLPTEGDFNINFLESNKNSNEILELFESYGLFPAFNEASRINLNTETCIDNIFTNIYKESYKCRTYDPHLSDHSVQELKLIDETPATKGQYITKYKITEENISKFEEKLNDIDWDSIKFESAEETFHEFHLVLKGCFDTSFPLFTVNVKRDEKCVKKTASNVALKKAVDAALTIHEVRQSEHSKKLLEMLKRSMRESYTSEKKRVHREYINSSEDKTKAIWKVIKQETARSKLNRENESKLTPDELNYFFSSIGQMISMQCTPSADGAINLMRTTPSRIPVSSSSVFNYPVTIDELNQNIKRFKNKKNEDIYGMNVVLMKRIYPRIAKVMCDMFNQCLEQGIFPEVLKFARVIPVYKNGKEDECTNYRPISILPTISKILEEILKRRLLEFLDRSRVLDQNQHGFRSGKSTMTALVALMENIVEAVDEGRLVEVLTCDLSKAFDSVERDILLQKMEIYGVRGKALAIFESYLKNRTQVVSWNNEISKVNILKYGVPQGSILGPLLFLIYVNDLPNNVSCSLTSMYADDASFVNDSFRRTDLEIKGAETLVSAEKWFSTNGLKLNVDKSCRMIVAGSERPQSVKVLGMTLDNRLTWNTYTTPLLKRLSTAIFTIRRMREVAGSDISVLT